jgi:hypothetical protein
MSRTFLVPKVRVLVPQWVPKGVQDAGVRMRNSTDAGEFYVMQSDSPDAQLDDFVQNTPGVVEVKTDAEALTAEERQKYAAAFGGKLAVGDKAETGEEMLATVRVAAMARQTLSVFKPENRTAFIEALQAQAALEDSAAISR